MLTKNIAVKVFVALILLFNMVAVSTFASEQKKGVERTVVTKTKEIGDHNISYTVSDLADKKNQVLTFLLIHGAGSNSKATNTLAYELGQKFDNAQIVQIDLPAHGESTGPALTDIFDIADVVGKFVDKGRESGEFANRIVPVGVSMGGSVAQLLDLQDVKGIDRIVLVSSSPDWTHLAPLSGLTKEVWTPFYNQLLLADFSVNTSPEQQAEFAAVYQTYSSSAETALADIQALIKFNIINRLDELDKKILLITGDADNVAPISNAHIWDEKVKKSELIVIPTETHTYVLKQPAFVAEKIFEFVK